MNRVHNSREPLEPPTKKLKPDFEDKRLNEIFQRIPRKNQEEALALIEMIQRFKELKVDF